MNMSLAIVRRRYTDHTLFYSAILIWKLLFFLPLLMFVNSGTDHVFQMYFVPYLTVIFLFRVMTYFATYKASFMEMTEMGLSLSLLIADVYLIALFDIPLPFALIILALALLHFSAAFSRFRWFRRRLWLNRHLEILNYLTDHGEVPIKIAVMAEDEMLVTTKSGKEFTYRQVYWSGFYIEHG